MKRGELLLGDRTVLQAFRTDSALERARGLLGRPCPSTGSGLLIAPCAGIHTFAMRYPIDSVFLDRGGCILSVIPALAPWRLARCAQANAVLELAAGEAARLGLQKGMTLIWREGECPNI